MNTRGFTILEVMAAVAIFCIAVLGLLLALQTTVDASRQVQRQKAIRSELQNRLARLSLPPFKEFRNETSTHGVNYQEEIRPEVVAARDSSAVSGFWRILVKAEWNDGGQPLTWEASHLAYAP